jgi:hypothetical protein
MAEKIELNEKSSEEKIKKLEAKVSKLESSIMKNLCLAFFGCAALLFLLPFSFNFGGIIAFWLLIVLLAISACVDIIILFKSKS